MPECLTREELLSIPAVERSDAAALVPDPRVSVLVITYNHAPYIAEAIESILRQAAPFSVELLIGEDRSSDETLAICERFRAQRPDAVRVITAEANVGAARNFLRLWARARSPYVAFCEGDDYWLDTRKLALQVECLDAHPDYSMCGSWVRVVGAGRQMAHDGERYGPPCLKSCYTLDDTLTTYLFQTSSAMFRNGVAQFPRAMLHMKALDRFLYVMHAMRGPIGFVDQVTSVHRRTQQGVSSGATRRRQYYMTLQQQKVMIRVVDGPHRAIARQVLTRTRWASLYFWVSQHRPGAARAVLRAEFANMCKLQPTPWLDLIAGTVVSWCPVFYKLLKSANNSLLSGRRPKKPAIPNRRVGPGLASRG